MRAEGVSDTFIEYPKTLGRIGIATEDRELARWKVPVPPYPWHRVAPPVNDRDFPMRDETIAIHAGCATILRRNRRHAIYQTVAYEFDSTSMVRISSTLRSPETSTPGS